MNILHKIKGYIKDKMDSNAYERSKIEEIKKDVQRQQQIEFEQEYKKRALEVAKQKAIEDAQNMSGYRRLQATSRALEMNQPKPNPFSKLSEYTQKNLAKRELNMQKTNIMRQTAREEMIKNQQKREMERQSKLARGIHINGIT